MASHQRFGRSAGGTACGLLALLLGGWMLLPLLSGALAFAAAAVFVLVVDGILWRICFDKSSPSKGQKEEPWPWEEDGQPLPKTPKDGSWLVVLDEDDDGC